MLGSIPSHGAMSYKDKEKQRQYQKEWYARQSQEKKRRLTEIGKISRDKNKDKIKAIKESHPCYDCGEFYPHYVMDFDHLYGKLVNVSQIANWRGWKEIKKEIAKCELVCSNCHRIRTHTRGYVVAKSIALELR